MSDLLFLIPLFGSLMMLGKIVVMGLDDRRSRMPRPIAVAVAQETRE